MAFEPGGHIGEQGKAGGVGFWKAVHTKALYLHKQPFGKVLVIASG